MNKIIKDARGKFIKGTCGNPKGRPKGCVNKKTKIKSKLYELASERIDEAFKLLWEAIEAKESWAFNIFFKDLLPKKAQQPTMTINEKATDPAERTEEIVKELGKQFTELTYDEAINEIKLFKYDTQKAQEEAKSYSREELIEQLQIVRHAIKERKK